MQVKGFKRMGMSAGDRVKRVGTSAAEREFSFDKN